jgi:hypothetical protein
VAPQRAEIRPFPKRSDEDQGGSDRQCRLIQPSRHQIQLLTARPAPAEPHRHVAKLECLNRVQFETRRFRIGSSPVGQL